MRLADGSVAGARWRVTVLVATLGVALLAAMPSPARVSAGGTAPARFAGPFQVSLKDLPGPPQQALQAASGRAVPRRSLSIPANPALAGAPARAANAVDSSVSSTTSSAAASPTVLSNRFEGLDNNSNSSLAGVTLTPPDPQLAVGPSHVVEFVNIVGRVSDKKGNAVNTFLLTDFFQVPTGWFDTDPRIIYDSLTSRWFATYVSMIDNSGAATDFARLHIAVSQTSDPTGAWNIYYLPFTNVFPDYEAIGLTDDKVTISANIFDIDGQHLSGTCSPVNAFCGEQTFVLQKSDLMAGNALNAVSLPAQPDPNLFTVRPAHSLSSTSDQYLATFELAAGLPSTDVTLIRVTGTPANGNVTEAPAIDLPVQAQNSPPASLTAGGGQITSGDFRMLEAVWRNGSLWLSASAACIPPGDGTMRSCIHLIQVNTGSSSVTQDIVYGAASQYYSWPATRTDPSGNLIVSMTHTNSSIFAEADATGRLASDPPNSLAGSIQLRQGDVLHTSSRWGDYLGAAVDPADPTCIWVAGEYAKATAGADWGTYLAALSYGGCDNDGDGWSNSSDNCPDWANPSQALPPWPVPASDPDCDGFSSSIEAFVGTDPTRHCAATPTANDEAIDSWPPDVNDDQKVDIVDVVLFRNVFNTVAPGPPYSKRFDLNADNAINIVDIVKLLPFFNTSCTP